MVRSKGSRIWAKKWSWNRPVNSSLPDSRLVGVGNRPYDLIREALRNRIRNQGSIDEKVRTVELDNLGEIKGTLQTDF